LWRWRDRREWTDQRIREHLDQPRISLWLLSVKGAPAGFFELREDDEQGVEAAYFGLLPEYVGRGLGGWLVSEAVRAAWAMEPRRVWLHTCTFDHPAALPNYVARGFCITRTEEYEVADVPD
jgi:GNAT superfamily N-acetyltransferase